MRSIFVNRLRGELQAKIKSLELDSLAAIKDWAPMFEERNKEWKGSGVASMEGGSFLWNSLSTRRADDKNPWGQQGRYWAEAKRW